MSLRLNWKAHAEATGIVCRLHLIQRVCSFPMSYQWGLFMIHPATAASVASSRHIMLALLCVSKEHLERPSVFLRTRDFLKSSFLMRNAVMSHGSTNPSALLGQQSR